MASNQDRKAQLANWGRKITELSEQAQRANAKVRFEDLLFIDELKALYAIAQTKFDELGAVTGPEQAGLEVEVQSAWVDLAATIDCHRNRQPGD